MNSPLEIIHSLAQGLSVDISLIRSDIQALEGKPIKDQYFGLSDACQNKALKDTDWSLLAGRVLIHEIKTQVAPTFSQTTKQLQSMCNDDYFAFVMEHSDELDSIIREDRDWGFDFFAVHTLLKSYLCRIMKAGSPRIMETPQYMYLRVATFLGYPDMETIREIYSDLSLGNYTHASPTLFNAGLYRPQLASCFLMGVEDSLTSITKSATDMAFISKNSGGLGIDVTSLRHSPIGTQQYVNKGIIPWIRIFEAWLDAVDQGGRRKGSGAIYLQPWHLDIEEFLDLKKANGPIKMRAHDLFYALWIPDLFMERVRKDEQWTLFCPALVQNLANLWGLEFEMAYAQFEKKASAGKIAYYRTVNARDLWGKIVLTVIETGMPYILFSDSCNRKSNQQNLGTIRCSNLCSEVIQYTDSENVASCNLASIALNSCVRTLKDESVVYDFQKLERLSTTLVRNLNLVIDRNYYPPQVPTIEACNKRNRPLGIGVQGLADTFALLDLEWEDPKAIQLNKDIFETIYYAAVKESVRLAKIRGPYETFKGSPASKGLFQFDLWDKEAEDREIRREFNKSEALNFEKFTPRPQGERYDWESLRKDMMEYGLRNSLLIALMPTASSASILGNMECFEPFTGMMYARKVLSGQFKFVNKHLVKDLKKINMWNDKISREIAKNGGSVQGLTTTDKKIYDRLEQIKRKYKIVYEIPQKLLLQMSLDRGRYVCQSQSFNCWMKDPTFKRLNAFLFYGWMKGAKTGLYYLRQQAKFNPIDFSNLREESCTDEVCVSCQG